VLDAHVRVLGGERVEPLEPSSTKIASYSLAGSDWSSSDRMQSSMSRPGL
jgi:hypothetical protein